MLRPEIPISLGANPAYVEYAEIDPNDQGHYAVLFTSWWSLQRTFVVVEQDICPNRGDIDSIMRCGHGWCYYPYSVGGVPRGPMLGLCKFSGEIMLSYPDLARRALYGRGKKHRWAHWVSVSEYIMQAVERAGYSAHQHGPPVRHLHTYT